MSQNEDLKQKLKQMIVQRLKLEIEPGEIEDDAPLFGEGLGLDSIDALELVVGLERDFGVTIPDQEVGRQAFASLKSLADYIASHRAS